MIWSFATLLVRERLFDFTDRVVCFNFSQGRRRFGKFEGLREGHEEPDGSSSMSYADLGVVTSNTTVVSAQGIPWRCYHI